MPAILFDLDGTLVDSLRDIAAVANHIRGVYQLPPLPLEMVRGFIGRGVEHFVKSAFPEVERERFGELFERYQRYYLENPCADGSLYPGVRETLDALRRGKPGLKFGVVTNKPSLVADKTLAHYLPGFPFDVIAGPERVSARKPDPRHLLDSLARIGVRPADAWYVGDDPVDAQCAQAAGVRFLGAGYGLGRVRAEESRMLSSFSQLLEKTAAA